MRSFCPARLLDLNSNCPYSNSGEGTKESRCRMTWILLPEIGVLARQVKLSSRPWRGSQKEVLIGIKSGCNSIGRWVIHFSRTTSHTIFWFVLFICVITLSYIAYMAWLSLKLIPPNPGLLRPHSKLYNNHTKPFLDFWMTHNKTRDDWTTVSTTVQTRNVFEELQFIWTITIFIYSKFVKRFH